MTRRKKRDFYEQRRIDQQSDYDYCHTVQIKLKLNKKTDKDIIDYLERHKRSRDSSMQGLIKKLLREDMAINP